jgi:hypothetical protein
MFRKLFSGADYFLPLFVAILACKVLWARFYFTNVTLLPFEMVHAASAVYHGNGVADIFGTGTGASAHVAPLYAYYLAGIYSVFGESPAANLPIQLLALAAASATVALLPAVARATGLPRATGILAVAILGLAPFAVDQDMDGVWEHTFSALGLLLTFFGVLRLQAADGRGVWIRAIMAGILLGGLALLSPSMVPGVLFGIAVGCVQPAVARRQIRAASGLALLVSALVLLPWTYRNYVVLGGFVPVRDNFPLELYVGNDSYADGRTMGTLDPSHSFGERHPNVSPVERARYVELGELAYMREKQAQALRWIGQNPRRFAWLSGRRFRLYWFPPGDLRFPRPLWYNVLGAGSFLGIVCLFLTRNLFRWQILGLLLGPSLPYLVTHFDTRYRYPTLWVSALLTSFVAVTVFHRTAGKKAVSILAACGANLPLHLSLPPCIW